MLSTSVRLGQSASMGKNVKKQHSEMFGTRRRAPTNPSSASRPTSEFGWQLALQESQLSPRDSVLEEDPHEEQEAKKPEAARLDGAAQQLHPSPPPPPPPIHRVARSNRTANEESIAGSSSSITNKDISELVQRYAKKEIGWQVGLQGQHIPPSEEERSPLREEDTNPYSGADIGSRETPRLEPKPLSAYKQDTFQQLNLDEAAKHYQGFSTSNEGISSSAPRSRSPVKTKSPKKDFLNNPFHAIRLQEHASKLSSNLIDLDDDRPLPKAPQNHRASKPSRPSRPAEEHYAHLLDCQYCPKRVTLTEVSQMSECLHVICHGCMVKHVEAQLSDSHFPIMCPMCSLLEMDETSKPGYLTVEIVDQLPLPQATLDVFLEFEISANSSSVSCPKCKMTMRVERTQYLEETVITCPVAQCHHRWCKFCLKDMPGVGSSSTKHKCKPSKKVGVRPCPGCGCQGRRIAEDNYIQCRGVGCQMHFCFKCGETIANASSVSDIPAAIAVHYKNCTRYSKGDKCKVQ